MGKIKKNYNFSFGRSACTLGCALLYLYLLMTFIKFYKIIFLFQMLIKKISKQHPLVQALLYP